MKMNSNENSEEYDGTVYDFIRMKYKNSKVNLGR